MRLHEWSLPLVDVAKMSHGFMTKLDEYVQAKYEDLVAKFLSQFEQYCRKIIRMQESGSKGPIGFIHFSMLQTNVLAKQHLIRLDAYDNNWYADSVECEGEYDVGEFLAYHEEFTNDLEKATMGLLSRGKLRDIQSAILEESEKYLLSIAEFLRMGIKKAVTEPWFQEMKREKVFIICIGGYCDRADILYKEDTSYKDATEVRRYLEKKQKLAYSHEICENLDLSGGNYEGIQLLFSNLAGCDFSNSRFNDASFLHSDFKDTTMSNACLEKTKIVDTDFSGSLLENVNFRGASLRNVSFVGAKLNKVSFEGVLLAEKLNFDQAKLIDTVIPENV